MLVPKTVGSNRLAAMCIHVYSNVDNNYVLREYKDLIVFCSYTYMYYEVDLLTFA